MANLLIDTTSEQARDLVIPAQQLQDSVNALGQGPVFPQSPPFTAGGAGENDGIIEVIENPASGTRRYFCECPEALYGGDDPPPYANTVGRIDNTGGAANKSALDAYMFYNHARTVVRGLICSKSNVIVAAKFTLLIYKVDPKSLLCTLMGGQPADLSSSAAAGLCYFKLPEPFLIVPGQYVLAFFKTTNSATAPGYFMFHQTFTTGSGSRKSFRIVNMALGVAPNTFSLKDASILPTWQWNWANWISDRDTQPPDPAVYSNIV